VIEVLAILCTIGLPMTWLILREYWKARDRHFELQQRGNVKQLAASEEERKQLEARLQNLESIVCSVDFELNKRLTRLAAEAEERKALPEPAAAVAAMAAVAAVAPGNTLPTAPTQAARPNPAAQPLSESRTQYRLGVLTGGQVVLGRYTVEREIGRGGMGAVYLARDAKLGEKVALKVISSLYAGDPAEAAERFRNEVQAARRVTHANVVRIHDLGEDGPLLFLSMEYVDGETLHARVKGRGLLPVAQAREIMGSVAAGVAAAHTAGVIHRDLKPQNVLLGSAGRAVKVIDFGLAKSSFQAGSTATGMILGTPEYMAPEQVRGLACDSRTDVYALGATAYYVLTGRPPFSGDTPIAIGFAQVHEQPQPLREIRPEIPVALEQAIMRALEKDPLKRHADAAAFGQAVWTLEAPR
jgi:serine/threonine-protein kinase